MSLAAQMQTLPIWRATRAACELTPPRAQRKQKRDCSKGKRELGGLRHLRERYIHSRRAKYGLKRKVVRNAAYYRSHYSAAFLVCYQILK